MTDYWHGFTIGLSTAPFLALAVLICGCLTVAAISWARWKRRELRARKEWTEKNPYWREAFEAGAKWRDDGYPPARPNLTQGMSPKGDRK